MQSIKVFGHKIPDTDTVASAISYAWYLQEIQGISATPYVLGDINKETAYVLDVFDVPKPIQLDTVRVGDQVVIVDTNNPEELPDNLDDAEIIEIIDHHKLTGGIATKTPLSITMRPMASTASLIYTIANPELHSMPKHIAGLLLSAIISDTLKFKSPTTTREDIEIAGELAKIAEVDLDEHAQAMFANKSDISDLSDHELILSDSKVFTIRDDKKVRVSVLETVLPNNALARVDGIKTAMCTVISDEKINDMLFLLLI